MTVEEGKTEKNQPTISPKRQAALKQPQATEHGSPKSKKTTNHNVPLHKLSLCTLEQTGPYWAQLAAASVPSSIIFSLSVLCLMVERAVLGQSDWEMTSLQYLQHASWMEVGTSMRFSGHQLIPESRPTSSLARYTDHSTGPCLSDSSLPLSCPCWWSPCLPQSAPTALLRTGVWRCNSSRDGQCTTHGFTWLQGVSPMLTFPVNQNKLPAYVKPNKHNLFFKVISAVV